MFRLHETTQRRVCRALFLLLCVVPTLATLATLAWAHRPWREQDWQESLREQLHVRAEVGAIDTPRPGLAHVEHVRLFDLRMNRKLLELSKVQVASNGQRFTLRADHLETEVDQFAMLATTIGTWLSTDGLPTLELDVNRLTILGPSHELLQLDSLQATIESDSTSKKRLELSVLPADQQTNPRSIKFVVDHQSSAHQIVLDARSGSLPTWLVADWVPASGPGAKWSGLIQWNNLNEALRGVFSGRITQFDPQQLIGKGALHFWRGEWTVDVEQLAWREGRIDKAVVQIVSGPGKISRSLLDEFCTRLYCTLASDAKKRMKAETSFDQFACRFELSEAGILLQGTCGDKGGLFAREGAPLLLEPSNRIPWLAQLVQVFHLPAHSWLPATREAHAMSGVLPLPSTANRKAPNSEGRRQ